MTQDYLIHVGKRVREERKKIGMSQVKLAELIGVNERCIRDIENAHNGCHLRTLKNIADSIGVDIKVFL